MRGNSDRSFGFVFALLCVAAALWTLREGGVRPAGFALAGAVLLLTALTVPQWLGPLNRAWHGLGLLLGRITTPIVMGLMFLLAVTPTALIRRALGHDPLRLRRAPPGGSYWLDRPRGAKPDLTRQF